MAQSVHFGGPMATNGKNARIMELAVSSARMAIDQSGPGLEYATLDEAVEAYLNNVHDTMLEWGLRSVRDFLTARSYFEQELTEHGCVKRWVKS